MACCAAETSLNNKTNVKNDYTVHYSNSNLIELLQALCRFILVIAILVTSVFMNVESIHEGFLQDIFCAGLMAAELMNGGTTINHTRTCTSIPTEQLSTLQHSSMSDIFNYTFLCGKHKIIEECGSLFVRLSKQGYSTKDMKSYITWLFNHSHTEDLHGVRICEHSNWNILKELSLFDLRSCMFDNCEENDNEAYISSYAKWASTNHGDKHCSCRVTIWIAKLLKTWKGKNEYVNGDNEPDNTTTEINQLFTTLCKELYYLDKWSNNQFVLMEKLLQTATTSYSFDLLASFLSKPVEESIWGRPEKVNLDAFYLIHQRLMIGNPTVTDTPGLTFPEAHKIVFSLTQFDMPPNYADLYLKKLTTFTNYDGPNTVALNEQVTNLFNMRNSESEIIGNGHELYPYFEDIIKHYHLYYKEEGY